MSVPFATGQKVEVDGIDIYYEKAGTGDHVVFFLPGALGKNRDMMI